MVIRTPALSLNRSLVVLAVLLLALAAVAAGRQLAGTSFPLPAAPVYAPAENPAPAAPATDATSAPLPTSNNAAPGVQTGASPVPPGETQTPTRIGVQPGRLPSLDGNDPAPAYGPQDADGKFPDLEAPPRN